MAEYQTYLGSFRSPGSAGSQAYAGIGFRPKALFIWSANTAQTPPEFNDFNYWSAGLTDGTSQVGITGISFDNAATSDMQQGLDTTALVLARDTAGTVQHRAALTSLDADGFTLDWTNIFSSEQRHYVFLAIGGTGVSCKVGEFASNTATGPQTFSGLSFRPSGVVFLPVQNAGTSEDRLTYPAVGWTDGANQGASYVFSQDSAAAAVTKRYQRTNKCLALGSVADGSVLAEASLTAFTASGFTLNWTTAPAAALRVFYLAFTGIPFQVGTLTQPATSQGQAVTGLGFQPGSVLLQSVNAAASASVQDGNDFSLGGEKHAGPARAVWLADKNGADPMESARYYSQTLAFAAGSVNSTGTASTLLSSATLAHSDEDGFTLDWSADGIQREMIWAAFGEEVSDTQPPDYVVTIGEEEINPIYITFRIQETMSGPDTMIAEIDSAAAPFTRFSLNDNVTVTENGVRVFGGVVTGIREKGLSGPNGGDLLVEIQATSYEINAQRRVITAAFSADSPVTLKQAMTTLVDDYYSDLGVTLHPDQVDGPDVPFLSFERHKGDQVNREIAEAVGYLQSIDFENRLRAWAPGDIAAPDNYDEDVNPELFTGDIQVEKQLQNGYANRVILVGEPIFVPDAVDIFTGDGVEDTFELTYKFHSGYGYLNVEGMAENLGLPPAQWILDTSIVPHTIRRAAGPLPNGDVVDIKYNGIFEPSATSEDAGEIATYGLWEHVEHVTAVPDDASAQEYADALLAKLLASKDEIVTADTRELGYHPGQTIGIECSDRELTGNYLITEVDTSGQAGGVRLIRRLTAAKSQNNEHDWRRIYQLWAKQGSGESTAPVTTTADDLGSGSTGLKLDDLAAPDDNTDLDASTSVHGLLRKLSNDPSQYLDGQGGWSTPAGTGSSPDQIVLTDAYGSLPAAADEGRLFLPNDGFYIERDTGAAWEPWGPIFPMVEPVSGDYAWINQGSASLNTTPGGIYLLAPATGAGTPSVVIRKKAAPSTPYTITAAFIPQLTTASGLSVGVGWRQSSDGKLVYIALDIGGAALNVYKFTSPTVFSATYAGVAILAVWPLFVRFTDNGTNRIVSWSRDGQNFLQIHSVGRTDFLTADEVMFAAQAQLASGNAAMTLLSWKET